MRCKGKSVSRYPDKENAATLLGEWVRHHEAIEQMLFLIKTSIGLDPDGPLWETVWKLFDAYTGTLAVEVGDAYGWMEWYQLENDMGAKGSQAGFDGVLRQINTPADLYALIEESRTRAAE